MRYGIFIGILLLLFSTCYQGDDVRTLFDIIKTYTKTENNDVGPSTSLTLRTITAHDDLNTKYIAPTVTSRERIVLDC